MVSIPNICFENINVHDFNHSWNPHYLLCFTAEFHGQTSFLDLPLVKDEQDFIPQQSPRSPQRFG